ncbi:hypothetical protein PI125_g2838 [Phytophthora idaei]|nr:hypothetical protein PI125_g2838 [Phytophthora idaei]
MCNDVCLQQNGEPLNVTSKDMLTLRVTTCGNVRAVKLTDVYYAADAQFDFVWKNKRKGLHVDAQGRKAGSGRQGRMRRGVRRGATSECTGSAGIRGEEMRTLVRGD